MAASDSSSSSLQKDALSMKEEGRRGRLQRLTRTVDDLLKREWMKLGLKVCDHEVKEYWKCRQDSGMFVVSSCRQSHIAMESCLTTFGRDEEKERWYQEYRLQGGINPLAVKKDGEAK